MYPEKLKVTLFEDNTANGEEIFILSDAKSTAAPEKPVYKSIQEISNEEWCIYFYPNPGGWRMSTEKDLEANKGGHNFKSKAFN